MPKTEKDFTACGARSLALERPTQRQDSLQDQLADVRKMARASGCYDAEDWIVSMSGRTFNTPPPQSSLVQDEMEAFIRNIRDNYDHDSDAHIYGTPCRCCDAEEILAKFKGGTK